VKGAKKLGTRLGNWLTCAQGRRLLEAPDAQNTERQRDMALFAAGAVECVEHLEIFIKWGLP
jgi:hypothetical protein